MPCLPNRLFPPAMPCPPRMGSRRSQAATPKAGSRPAIALDTATRSREEWRNCERCSCTSEAGRPVRQRCRRLAPTVRQRCRRSGPSVRQRLQRSGPSVRQRLQRQAGSESEGSPSVRQRLQRQTPPGGRGRGRSVRQRCRRCVWQRGSALEAGRGGILGGTRCAAGGRGGSAVRQRVRRGARWRLNSQESGFSQEPGF